MNKYIPQRVHKTEEYKPISGDYPIRLDANESPYPPPAKVQAEFSDALCRLEYNRYPLSAADFTVAAFSKAYSLSSENIVTGNGSDELISVIINTFLCEGDSLLVTAPDFSMYEFYGAQRGAKVISTPKTVKEGGHEIDFEELLKIVEQKCVKAVIFSNPCNPTGKEYDRQTVLDFVLRAGTLVIVDEAYIEFCEGECSLIKDSIRLENLIVLRTMSKAYGLAALRCGFAISNSEIISALYKMKSPYNVNSVTQAFVTAALNNRVLYTELISEIVRQKRRIYDFLRTLAANGEFEVYPSGANFVFARFGEQKAVEIFDLLLQRGIKVRCMPPYLRISAGSPSEIDEFIKVFKDIFLRGKEDEKSKY